jgi:uncharacterized protein
MRLFSGRISPIATEVVRVLSAANDIECGSSKEVVADIEAVLKQYLSTEKDVNEKTKDQLERTGRGMTEFGRLRVQMAEQQGIKVGDEMLDYLLDQVVNIFHHSANVDEIFAEDVELRRKMAPIFKKNMSEDAELDSEVRAQLRHITEDSRSWDVEYARVLEQVKRKRGLS